MISPHLLNGLVASSVPYSRILSTSHGSRWVYCICNLKMHFLSYPAQGPVSEMCCLEGTEQEFSDAGVITTLVTALKWKLNNLN